MTLTKDDLIELVGKKRGHFKEKANRIAKLIDDWPCLEAKMVGIIERGGGYTEQSMYGYATLMMMETGIRTGNETSAEGWVCENQIVCRKANKAKGLKVGDVIWQHPLYGQHVKTYGLTTLEHRHVKRRGKKLHINFVGKKLVDQDLTTDHPTLLTFCPSRGKPNELFLGIDYYSLKKFVKKYVGRQYTPKDLRMAKANLIFIDKFEKEIDSFEEQTTKSGRKKVLSATIEATANVIGHTKSVCRSAYLSQPLVTYLSNPPQEDCMNTRFSKEWYNEKQEKIAVVGGKRCRVTYHQTESRLGSYERGLKWSYTRWAMLFRLSDRKYSMDHGKTWHFSPTWAMKSKGKLKLKSELEQEFAFNDIQKLNREYEGPDFVWKR